MRLVIFGATGGTGRQLVEQALAAGHEVTALVRNPAAIDLQHERLQIVKGSVREQYCVGQVINGQDAVLSSLGSNQRGPITICTDGIEQILIAMTYLGVSRLIAVSSYGVADSHHRNLFNLLLWSTLKEKMLDKEQMENLIKQSKLDWTIVRPAALTTGPLTGRYRTGSNLHMRITSHISRADLAHFMLQQLTDQTYLGKTPALIA